MGQTKQVDRAFNLQLEQIVHRQPILDKATVKKYDAKEIDKQWGLTTEVVKREIKTDQRTRRALINFCNATVSELLPLEFVSTLGAINERTRKILDRYKNTLGTYLSLPTVPDDQLKPDINNSPELAIQGHIDFLLMIYGVDTQRAQQRLQEDIEDGTFLRGITREEKDLVAKRYKFGRDVKILSLGAEILEVGANLNNKKEVVLPSGIQIIADENTENVVADLLNPLNWQFRRQIKDRVYEISANGHKYILKEKKTARHTDTKKNGHVEGNLSSGEFDIARDFRERGVRTKEEITVRWERPLGYVHFPDGFQFTIFEPEEGLIAGNTISDALTNAIIEHRENYLDEFKEITASAGKFADDPRVMRLEDRQVPASGLLDRIAERAFGPRKVVVPDFTFEDFARVKAFVLEEQAREEMEDIITRNEYTNSDLDGFAFKIVPDESGRIHLEIFGFDFEYFSKIPTEESEERLKRRAMYGKEFDGLNFMNWQQGDRVTKMERMAFWALRSK